MKLSLKNINFKEIMMDHAEKIAFGLIIIVAAGVLWKTTWAGYDKEPTHFQQQVDSGLITLEKHNWNVEKADNPELAKKYKKQADNRSEMKKLIPPEDQATKNQIM